jgi:inner membrane protein
MTHAAIPLCLGIAAGRNIISTKFVVAGMALAMLPDADVVGFSMGIPYEADWGHRGASHSIVIAFAVSAALTVLVKPPRAVVTFLFLWLAMASHGMLDMLTSGGLGPALWWPWSSERIFAPIRPILVSPIGVEAFVSQRGLAVLLSELKWVWLPAAMVTATVLGVRKAFHWQSKQLPLG